MLLRSSLFRSVLVSLWFANIYGALDWKCAPVVHVALSPCSDLPLHFCFACHRLSPFSHSLYIFPSMLLRFRFSGRFWFHSDLLISMVRWIDSVLRWCMAYRGDRKMLVVREKVTVKCGKRGRMAVLLGVRRWRREAREVGSKFYLQLICQLITRMPL